MTLNPPVVISTLALMALWILLLQIRVFLLLRWARRANQLLTDHHALLLPNEPAPLQGDPP